MTRTITRDPVYVAGLERTGTSLLFALLASHPQIAMTRRTNLWTYFYEQFGDLGEDDNLDRCLDMMRQYKRLVVLDPDWNRLRSEFVEGPRTYARLFALLEQQQADRLNKPRWGDKSLHTERYAEPIFEAYPEARILHMIRDPRDRYASVLARWKVRRGGVGAGMAEWISSSRLAEKNQSEFPERYKVIRYEDLVSRPEALLQEICDFIGEDYTSRMLTMDGAAGFRDQGANSSYGSREVGKISTDSIGRYSEVLSARQVAFIEWIADEEMRALGYAPSEDLGLADRLVFASGTVPLEVARLEAWRVRYWYNNQVGRKLPSYRLVDVDEGA